jgi:hypothetical protein
VIGSSNSSFATKPCARASITFLEENFLVGDYIENAGTVVLRNGLALLGLHYSKVKKAPLHAVKACLESRYHLPKKTTKP